MTRNLGERSCLIVGAGMAGLTAAHALQDAGVTVLVLDKGRGVGGRMATRRFLGGVFDHGAQFITVRDDGLRQSMHGWLASGVAVRWSDGFPVAGERAATNGHPRYRGEAGMTAIPKALAAGVDVRLSELVHSIRVDDGQWSVETGGGGAYRGAALVLTPPVPQALALLDRGAAHLPYDIDAQLRGIEYHPCLALLALFDTPTGIPSPGGLQFESGPIRWMADNQQKGISPNAAAVTIHASPEFSRQHWEAGEGEIAEALLAAAAEWLPARAAGWQLHRWRYSQPTVTDPSLVAAYKFCWAGPPPIAFAGDAFAGGRVEGAAVSGRHAADRILDWLEPA